MTLQFPEGFLVRHATLQRGRHQIALYVDAQSLTGATCRYERAGMHVTRQFDRYEKKVRTGSELSTQALEEEQGDEAAERKQ